MLSYLPDQKNLFIAKVIEFLNLKNTGYLMSLLNIQVGYRQEAKLWFCIRNKMIVAIKNVINQLTIFFLINRWLLSRDLITIV